MDNIYLKTELKGTKHDPKIVKDRWTYGIILIGLALLRDTDASGRAYSKGQVIEDDPEISKEETVGKIATAIAPVLLPLIEHLGALSEEDFVL